ncbi:MAG: glycosyltransferase family 39 protein [Elusimicrobiota bacterium]|nr:glycosyltransferase family 39 protein [Elusimicrobiota bacterium]
MIRGASAPRAALFLAAALVLAGGALRAHQAWSHRDVYLPASMQEEGYYETAIGLLSYRTFSIGVPNATPRSWRGPIYPVFIALVESFSPVPEPGRVRLAQAALATLSILLVFVLGWTVVSPPAGLLAAALLAFDANHAAAVTSLNIHGFYSFLVLAICAALILWSERPTAKTTLLTGVFMGLTLLCRSSHFLLVPFMAAAAWRWRPLTGPRWRAPALLILGAALALAPMAARNRAVTGRWLLFPDAYGGAVALFGATTGKQGLMSYSVEQALELAEEAEPGFKASEPASSDLHAAILDLAVRRIAADPLGFAAQCLGRLALLARAAWLPLFLGLAGLALQRRNRRLQIALLLAFSFGSYSVAGGAPEHQAAARPLFYLLAGCGGAILLGRLVGSRPSEAAPVRGWRRAVLGAGPLLGSALFAATLLALAVEARQRLRLGSPPPFETEDRALALLGRQAEGRSPAALRAFSENLSRNGLRWAESGDCGTAEPRLRRALLLNPRQPEAAGMLAACLAAGTGAVEARALAARHAGLPAKERSAFWNACVQQTERLGLKEGLRLLALHRDPDDKTRRRIVGLWLNRAKAASQAGARDEALEALAQVEKLEPDTSERRTLVDFYRALEAYRRAADSLEALSRLRPRDAGLRIDLAELALKMGERDALRRSLALAEKLDLSAGQRRRLYGLYADLNEHARALAMLKPLLRLDPRDAALWLKRAELEAATGERASSLASLATAEGLPVLTVDQRRGVVALYRRLKEPKRGDAALEPLLRRAPEDPSLWLERAQFRSQAGEREEALAALARAERIGGLTPEQGGLAIGIYRELRAPRQGAAALAPLLARSPGDAGLWIDSAEFSAQAGDRKAALSSLARAEELAAVADPEGERRRRAALVYQSLGEYGRAAALFGDLARRFPSEGMFHADKGLCEYLSGDEPSATASLEKAITLKPRFLPAYLTLAAIHAAKGRRDEALKVYESGLAADPGARDPLRGVLLEEARKLRAGTPPRGS